MAHGVCGLMWLRILMRDMGLLGNDPTMLHCDNKAATEIAHNPIQLDRTKHSEINRHFIKGKLNGVCLM